MNTVLSIEAREKAKLQREEIIQKRREEREKLEDRMEENRNVDTNTDTKETGGCLLEISAEGKGLLEDNIDSDRTGSDEIKIDAAKEPVTYTKSGETVPSERL